MGPTASGKTALSTALAKLFSTEILSADSRQCYQELSIGVARPTSSELASVPHHFIASHSIHDQVNVAVYERYALAVAEKIFASHDDLVVCGGTGLYIHAFCNGIDDMPEIPDTVKALVLQKWETEGIQGIQQWIQQIDPLFWKKTLEQQNRVRLMRALEMKLATGKSLMDFQKEQEVVRPFQIKKIFIDWPREVLYERINQRVDQMIEQGLLDEVKHVFPFRSLKALQTVGYQELFDHLEGKCSLEFAVDKIKQHTRNYAKRQITWFKKEGWDITISGESLQKGNIPIELF